MKKKKSFYKKMAVVATFLILTFFALFILDVIYWHHSPGLLLCGVVFSIIAIVLFFNLDRNQRLLRHLRYLIYIIPHSEQKNNKIFNHTIDYSTGEVQFKISDLGAIDLNHVTVTVANLLLTSSSGLNHASDELISELEEYVCKLQEVDLEEYRKKVREVTWLNGRD